MFPTVANDESLEFLTNWQDHVDIEFYIMDDGVFRFTYIWQLRSFVISADSS